MIRRISYLLLALIAVGCDVGTEVGSDYGVSRQEQNKNQDGPVNFGAPINTSTGWEAEPTFTKDERTMYFARRDTNTAGLPVGGDIWVTHAISGTFNRFEDVQWEAPTKLGPEINTPGPVFEGEPIVSQDGTRLMFRTGRPGGLGRTDTVITDIVNGVFTTPRPLPPPINGPFDDHCVMLMNRKGETDLHTGTWIIWASNRPGGFGDNDLYESHSLSPDGTDPLDAVWSTPVNLGPNVNSPKNDHMGMLSKDMMTLTISSAREGGMGDEDLWYSEKQADGTWGPVQNFGPLINSPFEDRCNYWTVDGTIMVFDSTRPGGEGKRDLWWIYTKNIKHIIGKPP
jgi:hypothetical protein